MGEAKRKSQRACPALGRAITPAECGDGRNSKITCTLDCPHNPFSPTNYIEQFGPLEGKVIHKLAGYMAPELTPTERNEILNSKDQVDIHAHHVWHIYGRGLLDRWLDEGRLAEWKNDERTMAICQNTMRVTLTELIRIEDEVSVIVRDLFRPELGEIRLIDKSYSTGAMRYAVHLSWVYEVPAGLRTSGGATVIGDMGDREPEDALEILLKHLGAPETDRQRWLLGHMPLLRAAIAEVATARNQRMLTRSDFREVKRAFVLGKSGIKNLTAALMKDPQVNPDPDIDGDLSGTILEPKKPGERMQAVIGEFTIRGNRIETRAMTMKRADALRDYLLAMDRQLKMADESVNDMGSQFGNSQAINTDLVPEALLEGGGQIELTQHQFEERIDGEAAIIAQMTSELADRKMPVLDGLSPREAAVRPEMRVRLIRFMKGHICRNDKVRKEKGIDVDLNSVLEELGLAELVQPPPPLGRKPD